MHLKHVVFLMLCSAAFAQTEPKNVDTKTPEEKALFKQRQKTMLALSKSYTGIRASDEEKLTPMDAPLRRWTNPFLGIEHGLLVGWKDSNGRPMAVAQVYQWPTNRRWLMEHQSLSESAMTFKSPGNPSWSPKKPGIEWTKLESKAPKPANLSRLRISQLKSIARRFRARDTNTDDPNGRDLHMIPAPSMEYAVPDDGIAQGALFTFVSGTDPDVLLMIELRKDESKNSQSFYWAFAPMSTGKLWGYLDNKQVWQYHGKSYKPTDTFYPHPLPSVNDVISELN